MKLPILLVTVFCGVLAACQTVQRERGIVYVGDGIAVDSQIEWTFAEPDRTTVWTIDGLALDELVFLTGVNAGDPLLRIAGAAKKDMIAYNPTMLPDDVMEMIAGTLGQAGSQQLRTSTLRPVPFGTVTGFRFDLAYTTQDGLQMKGMALFAQRQNKLDVILFIAPSEYYFDHYAPTVEKIFSSVRLPDAASTKPAT